MSIVQHRCPACSAPLPIIQQSERLSCRYCGAALSVERHGSTVSVELAERMIGSLEQSGAQNQVEFRHLRLTQELTSAEMQLANVQSEMRSIQRGPVSGVSRTQLTELQAKQIELQQRTASLKAQLYPGSSAALTTPKRSTDLRLTPQRIGWLLFSFNGRANRLDFWVGTLVAVGIYLSLIVVSTFLRAMPDDGSAFAGAGTALLSFVSLLQLILLVWIGVAVGVKRFHDRDKAGWWVLVGLIPLVGAVWFLVELGLLPGSPGANRYG